MKIFISWSKEPSKQVAQALESWLPEVIQALKPWISTAIPAGSRWNNAIATQLEDAKFGIICVTPANQREPWLQFEAGALAKTLTEQTYVSPYLIRFENESLFESPLTAFQNVPANEKGTLDLLISINKAVGENGFDALSPTALVKSFEKSWPELKEVLENLPETMLQEHVKQPDSNEMMTEILETVRQLSRNVSRVSSTRRYTSDVNVRKHRLLRNQEALKGSSTGLLIMSGPGGRVFLAIEMLNALNEEYVNKVHAVEEELNILDNGDLSAVFNLYANDLPDENAVDQFKGRMSSVLSTLLLGYEFLDAD